jgi:hypothetical protein
MSEVMIFNDAMVAEKYVNYLTPRFYDHCRQELQLGHKYNTFEKFVDGYVYNDYIYLSEIISKYFESQPRGTISFVVDTTNEEVETFKRYTVEHRALVVNCIVRNIEQLLVDMLYNKYETVSDFISKLKKKEE